MKDLSDFSWGKVLGWGAFNNQGPLFMIKVLGVFTDQEKWNEKAWSPKITLQFDHEALFNDFGGAFAWSRCFIFS